MSKDFLEVGEIQVVKLRDDAIIPSFKSELAACADLYIVEDYTIQPHTNQICSTGLVLIPPRGFHIHIYIRSGLASRGLALSNSVGIIDSDYTGPKDEIKLLISNMGGSEISLSKHQRVAQLRLVQNIRPTNFKELTYDEIRDRRGRGGLGSTGER